MADVQSARLVGKTIIAWASVRECPPRLAPANAPRQGLSNLELDSIFNREAPFRTKPHSRQRAFRRARTGAWHRWDSPRRRRARSRAAHDRRARGSNDGEAQG